MAVVADPSGAMFCLWQAKKHIGAGRAGDPGSFCWFELATRDTKACTAFYTKLFGWTSEEMSMGDMHYTVFMEGKERRGGMMPMMKDAPPAMPSNWTVYFAVENCDATAKKAAAMGAKTLVPPTDIPNTGRFAIFMDPQGAVFDVLQPAPMP
jgi:predicted enzyme related to lactoylglutathione lyase